MAGKKCSEIERNTNYFRNGHTGIICILDLLYNIQLNLVVVIEMSR